MRLSLQTDYALRTLMYLAAHEGQHSIAEIAEQYGISKNHLMKVAQRLAAEGFVDSIRGRSGGLRLNQPADTINVGHVVRTFEDYGAFVECFDAAAGGCIVTPVCGLRHVLAGGVDAFLNHLDGFTVADLIGDKARFRSVWD
ncbi:MAG: Rrf2 family transcriptional regulator [Sphingomonadales bacterium]|nr:Rrf2 family transcriptional regulator [Sphingomonadales bacterium]PIX67220.1 MAG: Rrf2 family transcriptional regulator [Sphingomonadales bacterium CG_4_10_14_3_um_filter_58_15]NCO48652.1 Rrf2 family transcriptional regulator [Sphingomonadales bacterium]NCO99603.1 Rrf2 family transcriptional regulator [Sphingomonadales bacterium]NCP27119.1 Rrf2 family transcriptional regulator [Sphingomonadales bacterium]